MDNQEKVPVIRKSRELKYTGTILKFYEDTVCLLYTSIRRAETPKDYFATFDFCNVMKEYGK